MSDLELAERRIAALEKELEQAKKDQVWGFYEGELPHYEQGPGRHELQDLVTAEEVTNLVVEIEAFRGALLQINEIGGPAGAIAALALMNAVTTKGL